MKYIKVSKRLPQHTGKYFVQSKTGLKLSFPFESDNLSLIRVWRETIDSWIEEQSVEDDYTISEKKQINLFLTQFKAYFEGTGWGSDPIENIPILDFGITNIEYQFEKNKLFITITLYRPGLLIGSRGRILDGINDYLSNYNINISNLKESQIFNLKK